MVASIFLMTVDQFTKWLECFPLPQQSAEETARCVFDGFVSRFGCPLEIHTDQGKKNFDGKLFASVCELMQITKTRTTPYRPCSNGQVERYNRTLLQIIRCFLSGNQQTWDKYLQQLAGAIRSTVNRSTGFTPNMMMLGREVFLPDSLQFGLEVPVAGSKSEYVAKLRSILTKVHNLARESLATAQMHQKRDYDLRQKVNAYQVGDLVYKLDSVKKVGFSPKLQQVWKGPYIVSHVLTPVLFKIVDRRKSYVIHHDRLKPCQDRDIPLWVQRRRNSILNQGEHVPEVPESKIENSAPVLDSEPLGLDLLFDDTSEGDNGYDSSQGIVKLDSTQPLSVLDEPVGTSRSGRQLKKPRHLDDYYTDA